MHFPTLPSLVRIATKFRRVTAALLLVVGTLSVTGAQAQANTSSVVVPPPVITSFSPYHAHSAQLIKINGKHLKNATAVTFKSALGGTVTSNPININSAGTQCQVVVPAATCHGNLTITTPAGTSAAGPLFTTDAFISQVTPGNNVYLVSSGMGPKHLTIIGDRMDEVASVTIGGIALINPLVQHSPTSPTNEALTLDIPPLAGNAVIKGKLKIDGPCMTATRQGFFYLLPPPVITSKGVATNGLGQTFVTVGGHFLYTAQAEMNGPGGKVSVPVNAIGSSGTLLILGPVPTGASGPISLKCWSGNTSLAYPRPGATLPLLDPTLLERTIPCDFIPAPEDLEVVARESITEPEPAIVLSPNPARGTVTVSLAEASGIDELLTIADMMGRVVQKQWLPLGSTTKIISLADLSPGLYSIQCGKQTQRLVIE